jgi:tetratricopeptide (TPR) repeat protein
MSRIRIVSILLFALIASSSYGQIDMVTIGAGTPEDKELTAIGNEQDVPKKISLYQDFLQKYSANPMAVAFADWQLSLAYQTSGDLQKAIEAGDKALAASPRNLAILSSQATVAQQMKDNALVFKYVTRGGEIYNSIDKQAKPADLDDEQFQGLIQAEKQNNQGMYQFFQNSALGVIANEADPKTRMAYIQIHGDLPQLECR